MAASPPGRRMPAALEEQGKEAGGSGGWSDTISSEMNPLRLLPTAVRPLLPALALLLAPLAAAAPLLAQETDAEEASAEEQAPPPVTVEKVSVEPGSPGPESLVRLTVTLVNGAERPVTAFGFDVEVAGQRLPVYDNQLFLKELGAGETVELPLYNFWTSETGRPAPANGKLPVEVTLREARWLKLGEEEGTEVWTLEEPVEGLPSSSEIVVELAK